MSKQAQTSRPVHQQRTQLKKHQQYDALTSCKEKLAQAEQAMLALKEAQLKALADYNNLIKRQSQTAAKLDKRAGIELIEKILLPLAHLDIAAEHLQDQGINMIVDEFWQVLNGAGLKKINPLNQQFDEQFMEAVEQKGKGKTVVQVHQPGYEYRGQVIKPAKVVVG